MTGGADRKPAENQRILEERARTLAHAAEEEAVSEAIELVEVALEKERYGIDIGTVSEIQPLGEVVPVPGVPSYWVGLVNIRSHLVPLLDLRAYLGLPPFQFHRGENSGGTQKKKAAPTSGEKNGPREGGQIVLVNEGGRQVGMLVDGIIGVREVPMAEIGPPINKKATKDRKVTGGLTPDLLTLLDMERLLNDPRLIVQDETD